MTIKDIAQLAGVSISTVSKVLNNKLYVAPQTRRHVQDIIKRYNYQANSTARNLAQSKTYDIAYLDKFIRNIPFENPHMFNILLGAENKLQNKNYRISLVNLASKKTVSQILEAQLAIKQFDGILINSACMNPKIEKIILRYDLPAVCIGKLEFDSMLSWIDTNHRHSVAKAVNFLKHKGYHALCFMGGMLGDKISDERIQGFKQALLQYNDNKSSQIIYNKPNVQSIYSCTMQLMQSRKKPDAIVCNNSLIAYAVITCLNDLKLTMPNDVAVLTFDDYPYSQLIVPTPSVIEIDLYELGKQAASMLIHKIKNPAQLLQTYTTLPQIIERGTT